MCGTDVFFVFPTPIAFRVSENTIKCQLIPFSLVGNLKICVGPNLFLWGPNSSGCSFRVLLFWIRSKTG